MKRTENVELTVLCLLRSGSKLLLQNRVKDDWKGFALPGGHIERDESIVDAVIREMQEETGLTILEPKLCGVKQFPIENGRYIVFLFRADDYAGELRSSDEGEIQWVELSELPGLCTVDDFDKLIRVMFDDALNEFQYVKCDDKWIAMLK